MKRMKRESLILLAILGLATFLAGRVLPQVPAVLAAVVTSEDDRWNAINFMRTFAPTDR